MCSGRLGRPLPPWSLPTPSECLVHSFGTGCRPCPDVSKGYPRKGCPRSADLTQQGPGFQLLQSW